MGEAISGQSILPLETLPDALLYVSLSYARGGYEESSLASLERALARGLFDFATIDTNPSFASLRSDARFQELLSRYRN